MTYEEEVNAYWESLPPPEINNADDVAPHQEHNLMRKIGPALYHYLEQLETNGTNKRNINTHQIPKS